MLVSLIELLEVLKKLLKKTQRNFIKNVWWNSQNLTLNSTLNLIYELKVVIFYRKDLLMLTSVFKLLNMRDDKEMIVLKQYATRRCIVIFGRKNNFTGIVVRDISVTQGKLIKWGDNQVIQTGLLNSTNIFLHHFLRQIHLNSVLFPNHYFYLETEEMNTRIYS